MLRSRVCCVPGCTGINNNNMRLYKLPFDNMTLWTAWKKVCPFLKQIGPKQLVHARMCKLHFRSEDMDGMELRNKAVPSIHLPRIPPPGCNINIITSSNAVIATGCWSTQEEKEQQAKGDKGDSQDKVKRVVVNPHVQLNQSPDVACVVGATEEVKESKNNFDEIHALFLSYAATFRKLSSKFQTILKLDLAKIFARYEIKNAAYLEANRKHQLLQNAKRKSVCHQLKSSSLVNKINKPHLQSKFVPKPHLQTEQPKPEIKKTLNATLKMDTNISKFVNLNAKLASSDNIKSGIQVTNTTGNSSKAEVPKTNTNISNVLLKIVSPSTVNNNKITQVKTKVVSVENSKSLLSQVKRTYVVKRKLLTEQNPMQGNVVLQKILVGGGEVVPQGGTVIECYERSPKKSVDDPLSFPVKTEDSDPVILQEDGTTTITLPDGSVLKGFVVNPSDLSMKAVEAEIKSEDVS